MLYILIKNATILLKMPLNSAPRRPRSKAPRTYPVSQPLSISRSHSAAEEAPRTICAAVALSRHYEKTRITIFFFSPQKLHKLIIYAID